MYLQKVGLQNESIATLVNAFLYDVHLGSLRLYLQYQFFRVQFRRFTGILMNLIQYMLLQAGKLASSSLQFF